MRTQLTLDPAVATELAGSEDTVLKALEGHLDADVFLRGNVLTLEGSESDVEGGGERQASERSVSSNSSSSLPKKPFMPTDALSITTRRGLSNNRKPPMRACG